MELATRPIVIIVVVVMVLIAIASFFLFQSGTAISKADATRIFQQKCIDYGKRNCVWDVTYDQDFAQFVTSCKIINGQDKEAFSCLYSLCEQCRNFDIEQVACAGYCSRIQGLKNSGSGDVAAACSDYKTSAQCADIKCGACP